MAGMPILEAHAAAVRQNVRSKGRTAAPRSKADYGDGSSRRAPTELPSRFSRQTFRRRRGTSIGMKGAVL